MNYIYILPVGEIREETLISLGKGLEEILGFLYRISPPIKISDSLYNAEREQYNAEDIITEIAANMPGTSRKLLGVIDVDLFVPGLNFVFGIAEANSAVISLARLKPEFYSKEKDETLFRERALKEAIHELGHTFGLHHCLEKTCVMHFSNCLEDTDCKIAYFCRNCCMIISRKLSHYW